LIKALVIQNYMILAGDIGGTKTQLGVFHPENLRQPVAKAVFPSQSYSSLDDIVVEFANEIGERIESACFGVAGPVVDGNCTTTNLPWIVRSANLARILEVRSATLLNDLEAFGHGIPLLNDDEMCVLNEGQPATGNCGIIAAGTGLGQASMIWDGSQHIPSASEGGHVDFAPRNEIEVELLRFMLKQFDRVSIERLVSGPGLFLIYDFLRSAGFGVESDAVARRLVDEDPSSVVSAAALEESDELSVRALDVFTSLYGAAAGNLALTLLSTGGIYIGGGIAPKILKKLQDGTFMRAFTDKGRFAGLLSKMPVKVILNSELPLFGSARVAAARVASNSSRQQHLF
jgi:glucokinase